MVSNPTKPLGRRVKPTLESKFHIDYSWWESEGRDLRTYLISHLLPEQRLHFESNQPDNTVDWIDPQTAEVRRVDALQQSLAEPAKDPHSISQPTPLLDPPFRLFLPT